MQTLACNCAFFANFAAKMKTIATNSPMAWLLAARPKTLTAALSPVAIAMTLAYAQSVCSDSHVHSNQNHITFYLTGVLCLLFASIMQISANFINDYFDFKKGTDGNDRLGPERACAQGWITPHAMKWGIGITLFIASLIGLGILVSASSVLSTTYILYYNYTFLTALGIACIVFAFLYTTMLSYCGGGDLLVWIFFGYVPVLGTYYVLTGTLTPQAWYLACATGLATDALLVLNNYRDRNTDRVAGKRTLVVVFGEYFGVNFYLWQGVLAVLIASCGLGLYSLIFFTPYIIMHIRATYLMHRIKEGRKLNKILGATALNILLFAISTISAIILK